MNATYRSTKYHKDNRKGTASDKDRWYNGNMIGLKAKCKKEQDDEKSGYLIKLKKDKMYRVTEISS